jgi:carbon starvation protein CstA
VNTVEPDATMNMPQFLVELTTYVALSYKMYASELPVGKILNPAQFIHSQKTTFQASCYYHFHSISDHI